MTSPTEPEREAAFFSTIRSWNLVRADNRVLGGVASGVGARLGMTPALARILLVIGAIVLGGAIVLAYAAAWALLPSRDGRIVVQDLGRGVPNVGATIAIAIAAIIGLSTMNDGGFGMWWPLSGAPWGMHNTGLTGIASLLSTLFGLAVLGGVIWLVVYLVRQSRAGSAGATATPITPPSEPTAPTTEGADTADPINSGADGDSEVAPAPLAHEPLSQPTATLAASAPVTAALATAPAPRAARVPGPGKPFYLLSLAWVFLSAAGVAAVSYTRGLEVPGFIVWVIVFGLGLGLITAAVALSGRRMGAIGVFATLSLIPSIAAIGLADQIREGNLFDGGPVIINLSDAFGDAARRAVQEGFSDYDSVTLPAGCTVGIAAASDEGATMTFSDITADTSARLEGELTRVRIPEGTNLTLVAPRGTAENLAVAWNDRGIVCRVGTTTGTVATLATNGVEPELTLVLSPQTSTLIIEEQS